MAGRHKRQPEDPRIAVHTEQFARRRGAKVLKQRLSFHGASTTLTPGRQHCSGKNAAAFRRHMSSHQSVPARSAFAAQSLRIRRTPYGALAANRQVRLQAYPAMEFAVQGLVYTTIKLRHLVYAHRTFTHATTTALYNVHIRSRSQ
jgi:hypothetical protein